MKLIFIIIAVAYLLLFLVRWLLSLIYYKKGKSDVTDFPEELFTVVQPILSGFLSASESFLLKMSLRGLIQRVIRLSKL